MLWFAQFVAPRTDYPSSGYRHAYALLVHGTDAMSLYDSDADLTVMWQWNIARENRDKDVDLSMYIINTTLYLYTDAYRHIQTTVNKGP